MSHCSGLAVLSGETCFFTTKKVCVSVCVCVSMQVIRQFIVFMVPKKLGRSNESPVIFL